MYAKVAIYTHIPLLTQTDIWSLQDAKIVIAQAYSMFISQCLNLSTDPSNISAVMSQVVTNETEDADLVCEAFGIPTPNVTWRDGSGSIIEPGGGLTISNSLNQSVVGCARVFAQHVTNETVERTYVRIRNTSSIKFLLVKCLYVS